jgi:hypothetical protein
MIVIQRTPKQRRNDLVFVTNGIPSVFLCEEIAGCLYDGIDVQEITVSVPHFGILKVGQYPIANESSPLTIVHGRHSQVLQRILSEYGVQTQVVDNLKIVDGAAIKKLLWVSIMWLLCHECDENSERSSEHPLTVTEVHEQRNSDLKRLVNELIPPANLLLAQYHPESHDALAKGSSLSIGSAKDIIEYMEAYSYSMLNAIPNKVLAIDEFSQRNGYLLALDRSAAQPLHSHFVLQVVGYIPKV